MKTAQKNYFFFKPNYVEEQGTIPLNIHPNR